MTWSWWVLSVHCAQVGIVVLLPGDHRHELQLRRPARGTAMLAPAAPSWPAADPTRSAASAVRSCGSRRVQLGQQLVAGGKERVAVAHRGEPAGRHHLRLEPVGQHHVDVVAQHVCAPSRAISLGASSTLPLVAQRFLICSSSSGVRSTNMSSNSSSRSVASRDRALVVRPSYRIGTRRAVGLGLAGSCSGRDSPRRSWRCTSCAPMMIGVPVNPMRAQLGSALRRLACRALPCDRCASSTSTTMSSEVSSTPSDCSAPSSVFAGLRVAVLLDHREDQRLAGRGEQLLDLGDALGRPERSRRSARRCRRAASAGRSGR